MASFEQDNRPRSAGSKSSFLLQLINGFSLIIALAMVGVSCWGLAAWGDAKEGTWENVPTWAFYGAIAFGAFVMLVSVLGCVGAKKRNKCALVVYIVIVFLALIVQLAVAVYALGYYNYIGDAKNTENWQKVDSNVQKYIVDGFLEFAKASPPKWKDLQDYNECCGYNMAESYAKDCTATGFKTDLLVATGEACKPFTDGAAFCSAIAVATAAGDQALKLAYKTAESSLGTDFEFCQVKLLEETEKYSMALGVTAVVMVLSTFFALVAASRLACCVSSRDGGFAEEFGYGGAQGGQQQTTGGALTGTAGVNYA